MNETDLSKLQGEIIRLNKIIDVLLRENDLIHGKHSSLLMLCEEKGFIHSTSEAPENTNNAVYWKILQGTGMNTPIHSTSEQTTGINTTTHSQTEQGSGMKQAIHSTSELTTGTGQETHSTSEPTTGINTSTHSTSPQTIPVKQEIPLLPEKIEATNEVLSKLSSKLLEQKFIRTGNGTEAATAKLLVHFHNGGSGLYAELIKLTNYSQGGLAKLLMMLRKKNLIIRTAFQRYALTENGKNLLRLAVA